MRTKWFVLLVAAFTALTLWGCGSNGGSGGDSTSGAPEFGTDPDGNAYVGAGECVDCHQGLSFSQEAVADYLESKHVIHSSNINAGSDASCLVCHDPIGDGRTLEPFIDPEDVPAEGLAAVGCEVCHGGGGNHFGVGPIPILNPDYTVCGDCHNALPESHIPYHPFADNILDNYLKSAHYDEGEARDSSPCFRCHSDEGFRDYIGVTTGLDGAQLEIKLAGVADLKVASPVQCRTCHNPHSGELNANETTARVRVNGETLEPRPVSFSRQFNLCTSCHQAFLKATPVITEDPDEQESFEYFTYELAYNAETTEGTPYHGTDGDPTSDEPNDRLIWGTHFSDPKTGIVGYNIDASAENACSQCHDVHGATKFEQESASDYAVKWGDTPGFHGDYTSEAFTHVFRSAVCMECHNGSEFVKVIEGLAPDNLTLGDARVVACEACHDLQTTDASGEFLLGELRTINEFAFPYWESFQEENVVQFPDLELVTVDGLGENALCMTCHSGRASKIDVDNAEPQADGTYRFVNIHYRAAGASLFGNMAKGGYEYDGKVYASKFEHVDSNDLCVECHDAHSGELLFIDPDLGTSGCVNCHAGAEDVDGVRDIRMDASVADYDGDGDDTEGIYDEVDTLKTELEAVLVDSGVTILDGYPYFGNITTMEQLRAAYNLQVASKDPGSWAHNPSYTIQLLFDSLEAMGQKANSVTGLAYVRDDSGHFASEGEAFRHWDLSFDDETGEFDDGSVSSSCNKCHSSEGGAFFLGNGTNLVVYERTYTNGISSGLACETCHTSPYNEAVYAVESVEFPSGVTISDPDFAADNSNICMTCHQGRNSKVQVDEAIAAWDGSSEFRFTNIHYYAAAATLFGTDVMGGYEYDVNSNVGAQTYAAQNTFPAGVHATLNSCTDCHLQQGDNEHSFIPDIGVCNFCHAGSTFETLSGSPSANFAAINTLKGELKTVLEASGVVFLSGYPYFDNLFTPEQLKAAYNWQTADKDPCGYIHNGDYIQQLLFDSIVDMGGTPSVAAPDR